MLWFPVVVRWVDYDADGWTVGCMFERLTTTMQNALRTALFELSLVRQVTG